MGANGLLATAANSGGSSGSTYYAFDFRGNTANLFSSSSSVLANTTYKAYNNRNSDATYGLPYEGFGGQFGYYKDFDNIYLMGQRYYAMSQGRWLSRDPIGYAGGINVYSYAGNNPISFVDPSGLDVSVGEVVGQLGSGEVWREGVATSGYALGNLVTLGHAFGEQSNRPGFHESQAAWGVAGVAGTAGAGLAAAPVVASHPLFIAIAAGGGGAAAALESPIATEVESAAETCPAGAGAVGSQVISGHGTYLDMLGETQIPRGTSLTFYCAHGASLSDSVANLAETGGTLPAGQFTERFGPGEAVPNYILHPPDGLNIMGNPITVDEPTALSEILSPGMGGMHWAACRLYGVRP